MAAVLLPSKIKRQKIMDTAIQSNKTSRKRISDLLFILWAGGAALLSYSLVYMLRKPYTAAAFEEAHKQVNRDFVCHNRFFSLHNLQLSSQTVRQWPFRPAWSR